jgi:YfiH family protein
MAAPAASSATAAPAATSTTAALREEGALREETAEPLAASGVRHGFFTRTGGVSEGCYASLNCGLGSADAPERVRRNRSLVAARLGCGDGMSLVTGRQVHSAAVAVVEAPWPDGSAPRVDGLVTTVPRLAIGILSADCAPVLLADADRGVVGAAHAGWRGAKAGIVEATVAAMVRAGARVERIAAAVGPCIAQPSYEVGPEFRAAFVGDEPGTASLFAAAARDGHHRFDLKGYVAARLRRAGLRAIDVLPADTFAEEDRFFSYRRTVLRGGGGDYGRQVSAIALV